MTNRAITGRVTEAKRLTNSRDGNPRWRLTVEVDGRVERYLTLPDGAIGYAVSPATLPRWYDLALEDEWVVEMREFTPIAARREGAAPEEDSLAMEPPACVTCGLSSDDPAEARRIEDSEFCEFHRREDLANQVARLAADAEDVVKAAKHFERLDPALRAPVAVAQALVTLIHPDRVF